MGTEQDGFAGNGDYELPEEFDASCIRRAKTKITYSLGGARADELQDFCIIYLDDSGMHVAVSEKTSKTGIGSSYQDAYADLLVNIVIALKFVYKKLNESDGWKQLLLTSTDPRFFVADYGSRLSDEEHKLGVHAARIDLGLAKLGDDPVEIMSNRKQLAETLILEAVAS